MPNNRYFMQRCLDLAKLGAGTVSPNPMVGCVIVYEDRIVAEGYTAPYGGNHAEVQAILQLENKYGSEGAKNILQKADVYVSLEPCSHVGKTGACAVLLASYKPKHVYVACLDPNKKVNGKGIAILKEANIPCTVGLLEEEAQWLNRRFFTQIQKSRPYIILKWAQTQNNFIAPKGDDQQWISNKASVQLVHKWRAEEDAILVGRNTAVIDNPSLTTRHWEGKNPIRILIDKNLSVEETSNIFDAEAKTIVFNALKFDQRENVSWIELENFDLYLAETIMYQLFLMDVQSIIIEGGSKTLKKFIDANLWDEARVFTSTKSWKDGIEAPQLHGKIIQTQAVGDDTLDLWVPIN
ncbi:MAG TPA: bifunctional diaminohydroxyphosphoribosylaminopyrimidine deaminase/5-amino-6-(5-phosphoribosylamino)uracil reductase RibD [Candidatus Sphingobacterium stercoripullorum]|uniref:Riboflavin biosynthesis protein RibD n=1 Tax=Candidatus Sphingobacterium stercoripullorum TaxID=2838759 RepID=A0A9D1WC96_9SPHI|nr:bifunctional diaminohydroxyphosphoribosylaminopyrimidine deaminase/5-amino-6-(5-phosphoribosylamino)uracil reductase RibD [Candidatus Sphingobacterium stercoripullorum]HLR50016.1 bifunctional diaminohydroxyphosphoribosylaminopyrimidine deaminase/5-amino-6-(5-phosphoribosylamino)uracil reductase RibD [Candidatus Sphingobacterium stercoripullorum]